MIQRIPTGAESPCGSHIGPGRHRAGIWTGIGNHLTWRVTTCPTDYRRTDNHAPTRRTTVAFTDFRPGGRTAVRSSRARHRMRRLATAAVLIVGSLLAGL